MSDLQDKAGALRALHVPGEPLLLVNVWDAATARAVTDAGAKALATTSAGMNAALGYADGDSADADDFFAAIARITRAADLPVTADIEAGFQLEPSELLERLTVRGGAVGCNLEDTDHHGAGVLVDGDAHAARIAAVKAAAGRAGVDIVVNARTDGFLRHIDDPVAESIRRGRLYLDAGADCVYPITVAEEADIAAIVEALQAPVNVNLSPSSPSVARLAELGVARISTAGGLFRRTQRAAAAAASALLATGDSAELFG